VSASRSAAVAALLWTLWVGLARTADAPLVQAVGPIGLTVSDLDRSVAFFTEVLTFEKVSEAESFGDAYEHLHGVFGARVRVARLRLGQEEIELTEYLAPRGRPIPADARSNDRSFQHVAIIVTDMDAAYAVLRRHKVTHASSGPQTLPATIVPAAGIRAFYFKDPDGHALEILQFPPDKGDARWHQPGPRLFLGIDHTAIVVSDTDESLALYRDVLGLRVAGASENFGKEQEHLNNVFGARLRITGLRASGGPGIELLEYLAPADGRPAPADLKANDLAHWQTTLRVQGAEEAARRLFDAGAAFVSPGAVPAGELGFAFGLMLRDRDGHALRLVQR
jgi:catechol 2,3-dioxygenase-like lactoylglutathione lyase family enzyme